MMEVVLLISLLKKRLLTIQDECQKALEDKDFLLEDNRELINALRKDKNSIIDIDLVDIETILNELEVVEKDEILKYFEVIQTLLRLNKEKNTSYKLTESQLEYINLFLRKIDAYEKKRSKKKEQLENKKNDYQRLLDKLIDGREEITELDTLRNLFNDLSIKEEKQSRILISLLKYNKSLSQPKEELLPEWEVI